MRARALVAWLVLAACAPETASKTPAAPPPIRARDMAEPARDPQPALTKVDVPDVLPERDPFGEGYPPPFPSGDRVGSLNYGTWVQPIPSAGSLPLGGIRAGGSLRVLSTDPVPGQGRCPRFVRVEGGFVCLGARATLDMNSRWVRDNRWTTPAPGPMPYHYAMSVGAPMLTKPLPKEKMGAWKIGSREMPRMKGWDAGHDELAEDEPIKPNGPVPDFLENAGQTPMPWGEPKGVFIKMAPKGTMLAYTRAFEAFGEVWVLSSEMAVVPARGLKHYRVSNFRGLELGKNVELPIAWIRHAPKKKWKKTAQGFEPTGETWAARTWVAVTGDEEKSGSRRFLVTREPGIYIEKSDAALVEKRATPPWETGLKSPRKGQPDVEKWIHVRVNRGTLTLYEGPTPVFTTLMSPGKKDATPYGRYFIESKHRISSMSTEKGASQFWIADVPWTIYFKRPYAIHAAFWHEDFGERKSGGCVNLSPLDARRVFDWVVPELPEGWDNVQARGVGGTFVLVEG